MKISIQDLIQCTKKKFFSKKLNNYLFDLSYFYHCVVASELGLVKVLADGAILVSVGRNTC